MRANDTNRLKSRRRCTTMLGRRLPIALTLFCVVVCLSLGAARAADYKYGRFYDRFVVEPDGSYVEILEVHQSPLTRTAVQDLGQVDLSFSQSLADLEILEAYVQKADGRRIDVPADAIKLQDDSASDGAPMFTDEKHRIIIFPELEPEDWQVYKARIRQRTAYFPGHFLESWNFPRHVEVADARIEVSMPADRPLFVDVQDFAADKEWREGDRVHYTWSYRNSEPTEVNTTFAISSGDYGARLHLSTMADYGELAAAYESRAAGKAAPTDEIKKLADELTKGVTDRREQARRLYDWVNLNIRYVATYVGAGGYVPHAAADVMRNRYGDCKDHVTILEALLAAKGIESSAAIVNARASYLLPKVPSRAPFNHAITYLPEFDLFVDSTDRLAPFGALGMRVVDKPAIVTKLDDPIRRIPPQTADENGVEVTTDATLRADGSVAGKSHARVRGPQSEWMRSTISDASESQLREWASAWLHDIGLEGTSTVTSDDPYALDEVFAVSGDFSTKSLLDLSQPGAFYIPESHVMGYTLQSLADDILETTLDVNAICGAVSVVEKTNVALPSNIEVLSLPSNVYEKRGYLEYQADYGMMGGRLSVVRRFTDSSPHGQCAPDETRDQMAVAHIVKRDLQKLILYRPSPNL